MTTPVNHVSKGWGLVPALAIIILTLSVLLAWSVRDSINQSTDLFRPKVNVTNILHGTINDIRKEAKFVVSSAELTPEVEKREA